MVQVNSNLSIFGMAIVCWLLSACTPVKNDQALIKIDGSSTLFPLMEAFAETYQHQTRQPIVVGGSGTGAGLGRLCRGDVDIAGASRSISLDEQQQCRQKGIQYIAIPVARDAITVIVNPANQWVNCISPEELKKMWQRSAQHQINRWSQVNAQFVDQPLHLFGPSSDSGTYAHFTRAIIGKLNMSRGDYAATEDYNITVRGVAGDINALGLLGMTYWLHNKQQVKALAIRQPDGQCVLPSIQAIRENQYQPLSRELYVYINLGRYQQQREIQQLIDMMLNVETNQRLTLESGFVPFSAKQLENSRQQLTYRLGALASGQPAAKGVTNAY